MIVFFLFGVVCGFAVISIALQIFDPFGKHNRYRAKAVKSPPWYEGVLTPLEREVYSPISELVAKAEARAEREFYGASVMPSSVYRISAEEHDFLSNEERNRLRRARAARAVPPLSGPSGIIHLDPKANTGRWGDKSKRRTDGQYEKYIPGIGLIRAETPEKLERCESVVRDEHRRQIEDFNCLLRRFDELQSWLASVSRLDYGTSEKLAEKKTSIQKELWQIRQEIQEHSNNIWF